MASDDPAPMSEADTAALSRICLDYFGPAIRAVIAAIHAELATGKRPKRKMRESSEGLTLADAISRSTGRC